MSSTDFENVAPHALQADTLTLEIEPATPREENAVTTDYYEILRVGPQADEETIERVYRTLADRFHPDNQSTGDAGTFLRVREAYETLSDRAERAKYNLLRHDSRGAARFQLRGREFFDGVRGGQNRRMAVLCLLYRKKVSAPESGGLTLLDLEELTGCTREELSSALWYLCEKQWAAMGEFTAYSITAEGFDMVESKVEDRLEFRTLASWCYYELPAGFADSGDAGHSSADVLPLDIESAISTGEPERFRLRAREFFDGIRGEQLRRLAVLCLLYRQAASELPGLTLLDLEQLTGCTREELGSALWYLREKKWARYGEFTEYSITAAGFDVVEKKLDEREAARSRAWHAPEQTQGQDLVPLHPAESLRIVQAPAQVEQVTSVTPQLSGVSMMSYPTNAIAEPASGVAVTARKRVIFSMGGKGGVGKTSVMTGLAEWFEENQIPVALLDLDTENKAKGSLTHFFESRVPKINIHTPAGLDAFVDILAEDAPAILADMGAGAGKITHDWFHRMYPDVHAAGVVFTAVGVVTSDPASVESVVNWGTALENRVDYVIVENNLTEHTDFTYWHANAQAEEFRKRYQPSIIRLDYRLADLENAARNHGATLGRVARRTTGAPELQKASLVMRAQSARRRMFEEFDRVKELLLP